MKKAGDSRASDGAVTELWLLHLADSALPIGAFAHSFGVETLIAAELLDVGDLEKFLRAWLEESGVVEAVFCRTAFRIAQSTEFPVREWIAINDRFSAMKPARESRKASTLLGTNFLRSALAVCDLRRLTRTASFQDDLPVHHACAFGLVCGALNLDEDGAARAYLHQSVGGLISACQRLMPLGQTRAQQILWNLKPSMVEAAQSSSEATTDDVSGFLPMLDWGSMEHPELLTRLFIS
jgi:urease accessory protein